MPQRRIAEGSIGASSSRRGEDFPDFQAPEWLPDDLRALWERVMRQLPAYPDRRTAAAVWSSEIHRWDHRTLEALPLATRRLNGRACFSAREFAEYGFRRLLEAPPIRGGRDSDA